MSLDGAHVIPGITDPHAHVLYAAVKQGIRDGSRLGSRDDAIAAVREAADGTAETDWVVVLGVDHRAWAEPRRPTLAELDEASGGRPVLLADDTLHEGVASSAALAAAGVVSQPDPHGDVDRGRQGRPTGLVWERAFGRVTLPALRSLYTSSGDTDPAALLDTAFERLLRRGIVRIHEGAVHPDLVETLDAARRRTPIEVSWSVTGAAGVCEPPEQVATVVELPAGDGPHWAKVFADGGVRCAVSLPLSAALRGVRNALRHALETRSLLPLAALTERRTTVRNGQVVAKELRFTDDELTRLFAACGEAGVRPRVHAIGDLASTQAARVAKSVGLEAWSLEHVLILRDGDADRIAEGARVCNLQPRLLPDHADEIRATGAAEAVSLLPARSLARAGVTLALSSDDPNHLPDPLRDLRLAVTRRLPDGSFMDPDEAIGREEALAASTSGAVASVGLDVPGVITVGAPADIAVVEGDPFVDGSEVTATWIAGRRVG